MKKYDVARAASFIEDARDALILCHTNPDGDALGSAFALKRIFELLGKQSSVALASEVPERLAFMVPEGDYSYRDGMERDFDKVISVDVASVGQLGALAPLAPEIDLMIDHHSRGEVFADFLTDPEASAAGEIIFRIYRELISRGKIPVDGVAARYMYAAISADTGSFKFSNTTKETLLAAAELTGEINSEGGMLTSDIARLLHDTVTEKDMKISRAVSERMELYCNGALAVSYLTSDDMAAIGVRDSDLGGAIDVVRSLTGVIVAVFIKERGKGSYKISARSASDVDVSAVCEKFGGGGHARAAGGGVSAPDMESAKSLVVSAFSDAVNEFLSRGGKL